MFLFQFLYFILIGWWLGGLFALLGYLLCLSIIGLPIGVLILNRIPSLIFLHERNQHEISPTGRVNGEEVPFILRVIWFFVLGWEAGIFVLALGYILCLTFVGIPLGIYLLNRVPLVLTLSQRYRY